MSEPGLAQCQVFSPSITVTLTLTFATYHNSCIQYTLSTVGNPAYNLVAPTRSPPLQCITVYPLVSPPSFDRILLSLPRLSLWLLIINQLPPSGTFSRLFGSSMTSLELQFTSLVQRYTTPLLRGVHKSTLKVSIRSLFQY